MKRIIGLFIVILFTMNPLINAQSKEGDNLSLMIFGGPTVPLGMFGKNYSQEADITRRFGFQIGDDIGLAKLGFGFGAELSQKVITDNLSWIISVKYLHNPVDVSELEDEFGEDLGDSVSLAFNYGSWMNVPLFTGFKYHYDLMEDVRLYGTIQAGINVSLQPSRKAIVNGLVVEETTFKYTPDYGFELGFGVELLKNYNFGIKYINLGTPRYEGTRKLNENYFNSISKREMNVDGDKRNVAMLLIFIGYTL